MFFLIKEQSSYSQEKPLSHISEHNSENKGVGDRYKDGRIHFVIVRKPIHLYIHLKRLEDLRILQLCGRFAVDLIFIILYYTEEICVIFNIFHKSGRVFLGHPPAEDIESFLMLFYTGGYFPHIKIGGQSV